MTPRSGRAPRGERVVGVALRLTGVTAAMTVEGAMDRGAFDACVALVLVPRLHAGQVVVWDTLRVHTSDDAQRLIEARGCPLLWRPPASPDVTPIE
ncbi:MAG: transposase [Chloroflexota bacterium]|nr:transposase [Chloroflexota bacterium]